MAAAGLRARPVARLVGHRQHRRRPRARAHVGRPTSISSRPTTRAAPTTDALRHYEPKAGRLTVTVDVTWLGPYETGRAGAHHGRPRRAGAAGRPSPRSGWSGWPSCPPTRATSASHPKIELIGPDEPVPMSDVVWYPNQIDGRSNIAVGAPARGPRRHHLPRPHRLRHPALPRLRRGVARLPGPAAPDRPERRRHHHDQRRRRAPPARGGAPAGDRARAAAAAGPRPHPRGAGARCSGRGPRRAGEVVAGQAFRRRARQRLPAQEPRLRDQGVGGRAAGRASRATSCSPACTSRAAARRSRRTT